MKKIFILSWFLISCCFAMDEDTKGAWNGTKYDTNSSFQFESAKDHFSVIKNQVKPNWRALDIGCGTGSFTRYLAGQVPKGGVVGIDKSQSMIDTAKEKQKNEYADVSNLHFLVGAAEDIKVDEEVDLLTCFMAFHFMYNHEKALRAMAGCVKKGGLLIVDCGKKRKNNVLRNALLHTAKQFEEDFKEDLSLVDLNRQDSDGLAKLAIKCGLDPKVEEVPRRRTYETDDEFIEFVNAFLLGIKQFAALPEETRKIYLRATLKKYLELKPKEDGQIIYEVPILRLLARKK